MLPRGGFTLFKTVEKVRRNSTRDSFRRNRRSTGRNSQGLTQSDSKRSSFAENLEKLAAKLPDNCHNVGRPVSGNEVQIALSQILKDEVSNRGVNVYFVNGKRSKTPLDS